MSVEEMKAVVRRFFNDALDTGNLDLIDKLFNDNCRFYRGDFDEPLKGWAGMRSIVEKRVGLYRDFETTIHLMIGEGDLIASQQTHTGIHRGEFPTPIGTFDVKDKPIKWTSQVFFRFEGDKISENWVSRDELALFNYLNIKLVGSI
jgi:predicted ester cyclase